MRIMESSSVNASESQRAWISLLNILTLPWPVTNPTFVESLGSEGTSSASESTVLVASESGSDGLIPRESGIMRSVESESGKDGAFASESGTEGRPARVSGAAAGGLGASSGGFGGAFSGGFGGAFSGGLDAPSSEDLPPLPRPTPWGTPSSSSFLAWASWRAFSAASAALRRYSLTGSDMMSVRRCPDWTTSIESISQRGMVL